MANDLTNIMPKILARALMLLRKRLVMPRLVNGDYSAEAAKKGDVINVPIPVSKTATDVAPSSAPYQAPDTKQETVAIKLDQWKHSGFFLSDKDIAQIERNQHFIPMEMETSVNAIAEAVNSHLFSKYKRVYGFYGTPGTTPFATDIVAATQTRRVLNKQRCPKELRRFVIDDDAEANAIALAPFRDTSQSADNRVITEGELGRKLGFDWYSDDDVPTHTAGTGAGYLVNKAGGYAVGAEEIEVDTGAGTIVEGDIVTFAGHAQTYAVTSALAANKFSITPKLQAAVADNAAVTLKASHVVNLAFHRDAIAFATRPLVTDLELGNRIESLQDPKTGLVLRLEISRQNKQTLWDLDMLWGAELVRQELAARLAG